jgi:hypothetical protein
MMTPGANGLEQARNTEMFVALGCDIETVGGGEGWNDSKAHWWTKEIGIKEVHVDHF